MKSGLVWRITQTLSMQPSEHTLTNSQATILQIEDSCKGVKNMHTIQSHLHADRLLSTGSFKSRHQLALLYAYSTALG